MAADYHCTSTDIATHALKKQNVTTGGRNALVVIQKVGPCCGGLMEVSPPYSPLDPSRSTTWTIPPLAHKFVLVSETHFGLTSAPPRPSVSIVSVLLRTAGIPTLLTVMDETNASPVSPFDAPSRM